MKLLFFEYGGRILWFLKARIANGLWVGGSRFVFDTDSAVPVKKLATFLLPFLLLPFAFGPPKAWWSTVRQRFALLAPFAYVAVFGVVDTALSVVVYPREINYAFIRWWLVENEIVVTVVVATLAVAALHHVAERFVPPRFLMRCSRR